MNSPPLVAGRVHYLIDDIVKHLENSLPYTKIPITNHANFGVNPINCTICDKALGRIDTLMGRKDHVMKYRKFTSAQ